VHPLTELSESVDELAARAISTRSTRRSARWPRCIVNWRIGTYQGPAWSDSGKIKTASPESTAHARLTGRARWRRRPAAGARVRLRFFSRDLLEDVDLEIAVGHHFLQPTIFLLELTGPLDVGRFQRPEPLSPRVDRLITDAVLLATSAIGRWSASRRITTICSSVNRAFFMTPSVVRGRHSLRLQLVRKSPVRSRSFPAIFFHLSRPTAQSGRCKRLSSRSIVASSASHPADFCFHNSAEIVCDR
jgi:hypothetical protein